MDAILHPGSANFIFCINFDIENFGCLLIFPDLIFRLTPAERVKIFSIQLIIKSCYMLDSTSE